MEKEQENSYHKMNLNWYPGHMAKTITIQDYTG